MFARVFALVFLAAALAVGAAGLAAGSQPPTAEERRGSATAGVVLQKGDRYLLRTIRRHRREAWRWQALMGRRPHRSVPHAHASISRAYRHWVKRVWKRRAVRARRQARRPPHRRGWLCIQRNEGSWRDGGAPYYGGLQMDLGFQRTYGPALLRRKGTADRWTPLEQMWVAERAVRRGRGFYPWANTARLCGLL